MFLPKHNVQHKKGFTLIELLIVIGILGILAAGLLAALDPLDQLRRGRDSNRRNVATELVGALDRYYAVTGSMPWGTGATTVNDITTITGNIISTLVNSGELKSTFANGIPTGRTINLISDASTNIYSCFQPEAKAGNVDQNSIYTATGNPPTIGATCPGAATCYFCAR